MVRKVKQQRVWRSAAARRLIASAGGGVSVEDAVVIVTDRLLDGVATPPTDLRTIGARLGIVQFEEDPQLIYTGELRPLGDAFIVAYQIGLSRGRRSFTIAHEMGHVVIERSGPKAPREGEELERICDLIATELLMPRNVFARKASDLSGSHADKIIDLADMFEVSLHAASIRYRETRAVSVLEFAEGELVWAQGVLRAMPHDVPDALATAARGESVDDDVVLPRNSEWGGWWQLNGRPVPCDTGRRALVTLTPTRR